MLEKILRKGFVFCLGIIFAFALFECALGVLAHKPSPIPADDGKKWFTVLCLGNSYTAGTGVAHPEVDSYPAILERLLKRRFPSLPIRVINAGRNMANTSFVLDHLEPYLRAYHPDVVAMMVGEPNWTNDYKLNQYLAKHRGKAVPVFSKIKDSLNRFRVFQWIREIAREFQTDSEQNAYDAERFLGMATSEFFPDSGSSLDNHEAYFSVENYWKSRPDRTDLPFNLAQLSLRNGRIDLAEHWVDVGLAKANRFDLYTYLYLRHALKNADRKRMFSESRKIAGILDKMMAVSPGDKMIAAEIEFFDKRSDLSCQLMERAIQHAPKRLDRYPPVFNCLLSEGKEAELVALATAAAAMRPYEIRLFQPILQTIAFSLHDEKLKQAVNAILKQREMSLEDVEFFSSLDRGVIGDWAVSDIREIIRRVRESGVQKVFLQSYPPLRNLSYRPIDRLLPGVAREEHEAFLDIQAPMRRMFAHDKDWDSYYTQIYGSNDPHLSERGNQFIAGQMIQFLEKLNWLPEPQ